jgi:hypothetical protein
VKYANEIITLIGAYPERDWKMEEIVRGVAGARPLDRRQRNAARQAVLRVLTYLIGVGAVLRRPVRRGVRNSFTYRWKPHHR